MGKYIAKRVSLDEATLPNEIWKDIVETDGKYLISSLGRIYSNISLRILNINPNKITGYVNVPLDKRQGGKSYRVHRLVAKAFIPNPLNKKEVNHKNKDKSDNRVENLEWMNVWENQAHRNGINIWNNWLGRISTQDYSVGRRKIEGFSKRIIPMLEKMVPIN
jgi:hypothetical protein